MRGCGVDSQPATFGKFVDVGIATRPATQTGLADTAERAGASSCGVASTQSPFRLWQALSSFVGANVPDENAAAQGARGRFVCSSGCYDARNCRQGRG